MKYLPMTAALALVSLGAAARGEAPLFGPVPPPAASAVAAPAVAAPLMPTSYSNVFVREAPGTSAWSAGPSLVYRAPGAPHPTITGGPVGGGMSAPQPPMMVDGHLMAFADPATFPLARAVVTPAGATVAACGPVAPTPTHTTAKTAKETAR